MAKRWAVGVCWGAILRAYIARPVPCLSRGNLPDAAKGPAAQAQLPTYACWGFCGGGSIKSPLAAWTCVPCPLLAVWSAPTDEIGCAIVSHEVTRCPERLQQAAVPATPAAGRHMFEVAGAPKPYLRV